MSQQSDSTSHSGGGRVWIATLVAAVLALAAGVGAGIWWADRDDSNGDTTSTPSNCPSELPFVATYPAPNAVTINVYNSTDRQGLARSTADQMAVRGFVLGQVANDPRDATIAAPAEVRHGPAGLPAAQLVSFNVVGSTLVDDGRQDGTVDLVVGDAFTTLAGPEVVTAATTPPTPSPIPTGCPTPTVTAPPPGASPAASPAPSTPAATSPAPSPS